jgi:hypothetical protein
VQTHDGVTLSSAEVDYLVLSGRRGNARQYGQEQAARLSGRMATSLAATAFSVWLVNAFMCAGGHLH